MQANHCAADFDEDESYTTPPIVELRDCGRCQGTGLEPVYIAVPTKAVEGETMEMRFDQLALSSDFDFGFYPTHKDHGEFGHDMCHENVKRFIRSELEAQGKRVREKLGEVRTKEIVGEFPPKTLSLSVMDAAIDAVKAHSWNACLSEVNKKLDETGV